MADKTYQVKDGCVHRVKRSGKMLTYEEGETLKLSEASAKAFLDKLTTAASK